MQMQFKLLLKVFLYLLLMKIIFPQTIVQPVLTLSLLFSLLEFCEKFLINTPIDSQNDSQLKYLE